jgi:hypothetical protein
VRQGRSASISSVSTKIFFFCFVFELIFLSDLLLLFFFFFFVGRHSVRETAGRPFSQLVLLQVGFSLKKVKKTFNFFWQKKYTSEKCFVTNFCGRNKHFCKVFVVFDEKFLFLKLFFEKCPFEFPL